VARAACRNGKGELKFACAATGTGAHKKSPAQGGPARGRNRTLGLGANKRAEPMKHAWRSVVPLRRHFFAKFFRRENRLTAYQFSLANEETIPTLPVVLPMRQMPRLLSRPKETTTYLRLDRRARWLNYCFILILLGITTYV